MTTVEEELEEGTPAELGQARVKNRLQPQNVQPGIETIPC